MSICLPKSKYRIVLADPPWSYWGQQDKWGAAGKFYQTMSLDEICALDVGGLLEEPGVLFLWATGPKLDVAMSCIERWGLFFRGVAFVWVKTTRQGTPIGAQGVRPSIVKPLTEFVLAASNVERGRPLPLSDESITQTVFAPKTTHSTKPDEVQERIERMYPDATKIELFARRAREGWSGWGLEYPEPSDVA